MQKAGQASLGASSHGPQDSPPWKPPLEPREELEKRPGGPGDLNPENRPYYNQKSPTATKNTLSATRIGPEGPYRNHSGHCVQEGP